MTAVDLYDAKIYAKLINSVYYREFDGDLASQAIDAINSIDFQRLWDSGPKFVFDILSIPYKLTFSLENYYELGSKLNQDGDAAKEVEAVLSCAGRIYVIIQEKIRDMESSA